MPLEDWPIYRAGHAFATDVEQVAHELSLTAGAMNRLSLIGRPGRDVSLPDDTEADAPMRRMSVAAADRDATLEARSDPAAHPDLWWILSLIVDELLTTMDTCLPVEGFRGWPPLPRSAGDIGRHPYV